MLVGIELERAGETVDDRVGCVLRLALLQAGQVGDRDPGESCELFATEARNPATAEAGNPDVVGGDAIPPGAQELAELGRRPF